MEAYDSFEPPLAQAVGVFLKNHSPEISKKSPVDQALAFEQQDGRHKFTNLPLIDISRLGLEEGHPERKECERGIVEAARNLGFFQVVNHGFARDVLDQILKEEGKEVFRQPFGVKSAGGGKLGDLKAGSYSWGNALATCLRQMNWSEAYRIHYDEISSIQDETLRSALEMFGMVATGLVERLIEILAASLGADTAFFRENCTQESCHLRLNRYPPCPNYSSEVCGLIPHTDTDFLTIVCQDGVGGLQLLKDDGTWASVSPNPNALVINVGDFLQAWSNGVYKSAKHRVMASPKEERISVAFFYGPKSDAVIKSCIGSSVYSSFTSEEYQLQLVKDVRATGEKLGLSSFLL